MCVLDLFICRWTINVRWSENFCLSRSSHSYWWKRPVADWVKIFFICNPFVWNYFGLVTNDLQSKFIFVTFFPTSCRGGIPDSFTWPHQELNGCTSIICNYIVILAGGKSEQPTLYWTMFFLWLVYEAHICVLVSSLLIRSSRTHIRARQR